VWERRAEPGGATVFVNRLTGAREPRLPTVPYFDVVFGPGPLGLELERAWSGTARGGVPSGRRNSAADVGALVKAVVRGGAADATPVRPGHQVVALNGDSLKDCDFATTIAMLQTAPRPLRLTLHDPTAVAPDVAARAAAAAAAVPDVGALAAALGSMRPIPAAPLGPAAPYPGGFVMGVAPAAPGYGGWAPWPR
jgi:hypothetical protein